MKTSRSVPIVCAILILASLLAAGIAPLESRAITLILSDNGQPWDIRDSSGPAGVDDGSVAEGGQEAFNGFGSLRVRVLDQDDNAIVDEELLCGFGLTHDEGRRWFTTTPVEVGTGSCGDTQTEAEATSQTHQSSQNQRRSASVVPADSSPSGVFVSRALFAPFDKDYLRYIDTFTNNSGATRKVVVAWGGDLGSDDCTLQARSSSGDRLIDFSDRWGVTIENCAMNPDGPATDAVVGYAFRGPTDVSFFNTGSFVSNPFTTQWGGDGDDAVAFVFQMTMAPDQSLSLAYFLFRGLEEETTGPFGQNPTTGEQIAVAKAALATLLTNPDFGDLAPTERAGIVNWPPGTDLTISKTLVTSGPYVVGHSLAYNITVTNAGPSAAPNVSITDPIPASTGFQSLTSPAGWSASTPAVGSAGAVTMTKPSVGVGESASFTLVVKLASTGSLNNTAAVSSSDPDTNPGNNTSTAFASGAIFDFCVQSSFGVLDFNLSGAYQFVSCSKGVNLSGTGVVTTSFCKVELKDNNPRRAPGRTVAALVNTCTSRGDATIKITSTGQTFTLVDTNITNNTCSCNENR